MATMSGAGMGSSAPVRTSSCGGFGSGSVSSSGSGFGTAGRPSTSSMACASSFSTPRLLPISSRSLPSLLVPPGTPGASARRVMANPSLLPPAVGTPSQLAHSMHALRAHNVSAVVRRDFELERDEARRHDGHKDDDGEEEEEYDDDTYSDEVRRATANREAQSGRERPASVGFLTSTAFWDDGQRLDSFGGKTAAISVSKRAGAVAPASSLPKDATMPALWAAGPVSLPMRRGQQATPGSVGSSSSLSAAAAANSTGPYSNEELQQERRLGGLRAEISSTLDGLLDRREVRFTPFKNSDEMHGLS